MMEYNLLTRKLLEEGYTADNYPDYVRLPGGCWGKDPLQNIYGGFEYTAGYLGGMVFKTGCGLMVKGSCFRYGSMSFMGTEWRPENDNPVMLCPYRKDSCNLRNQILCSINGIAQCDCHQTEETYNYGKSHEKVLDEEEREIRRKYGEFAKGRGGHVCQWHCRYDYRARKWEQIYDPMTCISYCMNAGGLCDLTGRPVSKEKGNVFYDVKVSHIRRDGTLFDGEEVVTIEKGVRFLKKSSPMTICEEIAKKYVGKIQEKEERRRRSEILLFGAKVEVLNIRAERREGRDLTQDLLDIQNGMRVIHTSDEEKQRQTDKRERRQQAYRKRIEKLEKKLMETSYYDLPEHSLDRIHADKWLGEERIMELEEIRQQRQKEEQERPVQLSIFDCGVEA